jgi:hypothetical protein
MTRNVPSEDLVSSTVTQDTNDEKEAASRPTVASVRCDHESHHASHDVRHESYPARTAQRSIKEAYSTGIRM